MSTAGKWTSRRTGREGFTLFELVVVIAVLAVMAGLLVPNLDFGDRDRSVGAVVGTVQDGLARGRTLARLRGEPVKVACAGTALLVGPEGERYAFPGDARFVRLVRPEGADGPPDELTVDRRGIIPLSILVVNVEDEIYSLRIPPVLRRVEYVAGEAGFEDFAD
jgi:prepilin-type N-terminal cleavage/methylation domain-containing protein